MSQLTEITIRPWTEEDLALEERLLGDPVVTQYLGGPETPARIRARHELFLRLSASGKGAKFAIVVGPEQVAAGSVGYWETEWQGQTVWETGWLVLPEWQGHGLATQGILAMMDLVRAARRHRFLHAYPAVDNAPSNAVCRKVGFTLVGTFDFEYPPGHPVRNNDWVIDLFPDEVTGG